MMIFFFFYFQKLVLGHVAVVEVVEVSKKTAAFLVFFKQNVPLTVCDSCRLLLAQLAGLLLVQLPKTPKPLGFPSLLYVLGGTLVTEESSALRPPRSSAVLLSLLLYSLISLIVYCYLFIYF